MPQLSNLYNLNAAPFCLCIMRQSLGSSPGFGEMCPLVVMDHHIPKGSAWLSPYTPLTLTPIPFSSYLTYPGSIPALPPSLILTTHSSYSISYSVSVHSPSLCLCTLALYTYPFLIPRALLPLCFYSPNSTPAASPR